MILHDFTYEWDGKSKDGEKPIAWWPGAYRVKIVQIGDDTGEIQHLFPIIVILKSIKTGDKLSVSLRNYIHNFAEKLSEIYDLDINKVLWVELGEDTKVAHLNPDRKLPNQILYTVSWRDAHPHELEMIAPYTEDFK